MESSEPHERGLVKVFGDMCGENFAPFEFREGVGLEFSMVEHWKSIIQKKQIEMSFKAWLLLVRAKNMGGKCIWDYSNSTKD